MKKETNQVNGKEEFSVPKAVFIKGDVVESEEKKKIRVHEEGGDAKSPT